MAIKAAIFDLFGTVVDWRSGVADAVAPAFRAACVEVDAHAFADAWRAAYQPAMEEVRSGRRGYVALDDLHFENLDRALVQFAIADRFGPEMRAELNTAWERLPPWGDSVAGLGRIKALMPIAPCSNGSIAMMVALARYGRLPWDAILGAEIARAYKPMAEVYLAAAAALRLAPQEVLMVAAHNGDLVAAREAGLATAFFPRPTEYGLGQTTDLSPSAEWDFLAHDLVDLAARLGG